MTRPTRATTDGAAYLALQRKARDEGRPTNELLHLYALEGLLDRIGRSEFTDKLVLKGGVLLAAFDTRRPTRDIDLQAQALPNEVNQVLATIQQVARLPVDDGLVFDTDNAAADIIRDEDTYSGVRVTVTARLNRAKLPFHVDVNVGDLGRPRSGRRGAPRSLGPHLSRVASARIGGHCGMHGLGQLAMLTLGHTALDMAGARIIPAVPDGNPEAPASLPPLRQRPRPGHYL